MKIRTKLRLLVLLPVGLALFFAACAVISSQLIATSLSRSDIAGQVVQGVVELNMRTNEYLRYGGQLQDDRWEQQYNRLRDLLFEMQQATLTDSEYVLAGEMRRLHVEMHLLFRQVVNYRKGAPLPPAELVSDDLEADLVRQLLRKSHSLVSRANLLQMVMHAEALELHYQTNLVVGVALAVGIMAILLISSLLSQSIFSPIEKLRQGAEVASAGNLDVRVDVRGEDEIGELASAFNDMTRHLHDFYLALEQEVAERRQAEEALQEHRDQLEMTVAERTAALRRSNRELARSNAELEQFAYIASHDLQEPLRGVSGCLQVLERKYKADLDGLAEQLIEHAVAGSGRMKELIDALLSFSRVGTSKAPFAPVPLGEVVADVRDDLQAAISESGAVIEVGELPTVTGDPAQLRQLLQNLIGNAIKFCGEAPPRIEVEAEARQEVWRIAVKDHGIGLEKRYFERIFTVFQRLHTREEYPGTGIGLAICKKIAERHGGRIEVISEPGEGATFYVELPKQPPVDHD